MPRRKPSRVLLSAAFHEVMRNPPSILARTRRKKGKSAARKQQIAIAFSKARRRDTK